MNQEVSTARQTLTQSFLSDGLVPGSYSHGWFCNIKLVIYDNLIDIMPGELNDQIKSNTSKLSARIANQIMQRLFNIPTNYE